IRSQYTITICRSRSLRWPVILGNCKTRQGHVSRSCDMLASVLDWDFRYAPLFAPEHGSIMLFAIKSDRTGRSWCQKKYLQIVGVIFLGITIAFGNEEMQTAKIVAVKKHAEGRIISWQGRIPIFDNYPFFDITLRWKSKNYVVRYESPGAYYPKAW